MDLDVEMDQARNGGCNTWNLGGLTYAYGRMFRRPSFERGEAPSPQDSGDGSNAVEVLAPIVYGAAKVLRGGAYGRNEVDGKELAASLCNQPGGNGGQHAGHG